MTRRTTTAITRNARLGGYSKSLAQAPPSGFTLIELVISLAILVIMFSVAYGSLMSLIRSKATLDEYRDTQAVAYSILARITRELQLASARSDLLPEAATPNQFYPQNVCLVGGRQGGGKADSDTIAFMANGVGQYILGENSFAGEVKISYHLEEDPESQPRTFALVRDETPNIRPLERAFERIMRFPVSQNVISLNFRYYDTQNSEWLSEWGNTEHNGLPPIVEISFKILTPGGEVKGYRTAVPMASTRDTN